MAKRRTSSAVECHLCGVTISRRADLARHLRTHATNKEDLMHLCPYVGCEYKTLQRSNLTTHLNVHSGERPHECPEDGCDFTSSDPGSLTRHRKEIHGYEPKANSGNHGSAITRRAARRQRRISPYAIPSSTSPSSSGCSGRSVSPQGSSSSMHHSPSPQTPQMLEPCATSSPLLTDTQSIENTSAAYSTELITQVPQVDDSTHAINPEPKNVLPLTSELLTSPEAPTVEHPRLPVPVQVDLHAVDLPAQPVSETTLTGDEELNNFLAQLDDWFLPTRTAASLPTPVVEHTADDAPAPTLTFLPMPAVQYTVNNVPAPAPAYSPSYEYTIDNASYGYPTAAVPFDARFSLPYPFATPGMVYPQVFNQTCLYPAPAATNVFPMQGLYQ